jgi:hypothetical protein
MEWRTIESAPKDGTRVLILAEGKAIEGWQQSWKDYEGNERGSWEAISLESHGCGCCAGGDPNPTHWMPLPAKP